MFLRADSLSRSKNREVLWKVCKNLALICRSENICFLLTAVLFVCAQFLFSLSSLLFLKFLKFCFLGEKSEGFSGLELSREEATFSQL